MYAYDLGANDRRETMRPTHMRPRQELHETEIAGMQASYARMQPAYERMKAAYETTLDSRDLNIPLGGYDVRCCESVRIRPD